ncbi:MAG: uridine kinase [Chloroflexi bacterium]|nr:uridine kinase [Chloroflexota bacterium]
MSHSKKPPLILGIAGGTGSGKTTVAHSILDRVGSHRISFLPQDVYYRDLKEIPLEERAKQNFDHPDSLETELMIEHLRLLKQWKAIDMPQYDFTQHIRTDHVLHIEPRRVIVVDGILIFAEPALRELFDVKIFVDTDADIRFIRRLQRDIIERGRTMDSVIQQYYRTVRPMHLEFVEPSKRYADVIIPEGGMNVVALDMVIARIEELLQE